MKLKRWIQCTLGGLVLLGGVYYTFFTLPEEDLTTGQIIEQYQFNTPGDWKPKLTKVSETQFDFTFQSYDGETVFGRIEYPKTQQDKYPVLIGLHAMGRSYPRWWVDELNGNPTVTSVNQITQAALSKGIAVVSIDARYHGKRKVADKPLRSIWIDLHFLGDKSLYQEMIINTVNDNRMLIDWLSTQKNIDAQAIHVAGYSMGGQIALLLGAIDKRISKIAAIVPPFIDNKIAAVAPKNLVQDITNNQVLMITAADDENATVAENNLVFEKMVTKNKKMIRFDGGHILPSKYVEKINEWL